MAKPRGRTQRRHLRDKAVIDHLVKEIPENGSRDEGHTVHSPTTADGAPVEEQIRKEWDPGKGGLPTF
jgi:hypothetical protein